MPTPIIIYSYNPLWIDLYQKEKDLILKVLDSKCLSINHIGSTSIVGLPSKDIVDIIVGVKSKKIADECQKELYDFGYTDVTIEEHDEWFYCLGKKLEGAYCHLHLVLEVSTHHLNHLIFRDYLRTHPEALKEYTNLKYELAAKYRNDREAYTNAKTGFIEKILSLAKKDNLIT
ncbi:GrpB family protein [Candidatus Bathyarchaeota archaeon]|nr:GrpB family protein [Candidatus Bathyarchaeota archaeon]